MIPHAVLEIHLYRSDHDAYGVGLIYHRGDSDTDVRLCRGTAQFHPDFAALESLRLEPEKYGKLLTEELFADPRLRAGFAAGKAKAEALDLTLTVRLQIEPDAPELNTLYWETLHDPEEEKPMFRGERMSFSRYLSGFDWRSVEIKNEDAFKALTMISSPRDLADYDLARIDVAAEKARAEAVLTGIPNNIIASGGNAQLVTLMEELRAGYDILYIVCHGLLKNGESWLWMESKDGNTARVNGTELASRMSELKHLPRLVILISCQSAGSEFSRTDFFSALGPQLAEAGVPAVLAMQGRISFETTAQFLPAFFKELHHSGHLATSMAVARGAVRGRPDWWMPVLFTRLKSGQLWHRSAADPHAEEDHVKTDTLFGQRLEQITEPEPPPADTPQKVDPAPPPDPEPTPTRRAPIQDLVNPILGSVSSVFSRFLNVRVSRKDIKLQRISAALYDLTSEITFRAQHFEGSLFLCLKEETLLPIIEKTLGSTGGVVTSEGMDLIGELSNMIIGNAKGSLPPTHHFRISTPTIISGKEHMVSIFSQYTVLRISFDSDLGPFDINLYVDGFAGAQDQENTKNLGRFKFKPEVVEPLMKSAENIFENFLGFDLRKKGVAMKEVLKPKFELSGILNMFTIDIRGKVLLNLSDKLALAVHKQLLGEEKTHVDESVQDTICELVNIITGNAKAGYSKQGLVYKLSVPYAIHGRNQIISSSGGDPFISSTYWTNMGFFEICTSFTGSDN